MKERCSERDLSPSSGGALSAAAIRCIRAIAALTMLMGLPAFAASEEGADTSEFVWQIVNFVLLIGVLFYVARKPVRQYFAQRREEIQTEVEGAAELLKRAETRFTEWQRKLVDLDQELDEIRATARSRAQEERDRILADARVAAERIRRDAGAAMEQELRRAQAELRAEASDLAAELAESMLREQVREADLDRLVDEFISRVERAPDEDGR